MNNHPGEQLNGTRDSALYSVQAGTGTAGAQSLGSTQVSMHKLGRGLIAWMARNKAAPRRGLGASTVCAPYIPQASMHHVPTTFSVIQGESIHVSDRGTAKKKPAASEDKFANIFAVMFAFSTIELEHHHRILTLL
jgi:hypothetical protein